MRGLAVFLVFDVALILGLGLVMLFDTSSASVINLSLEQSTHYAVVKQLTSIFLGGVAIWLIWGNMGYQTLLRYHKHIYVGGVILLLLVFVPGVGQWRNGAYRWIGVASYSLQPSEFAKIIIPLFIVGFFRKHVAEELCGRTLLKLLAWCGVPIILIFLEPDNATIVILVSLIVAMLFLEKVPFKLWGYPLLAFTVVGGAIAAQLPYVMARIDSYLNPHQDIMGKGHQPYQAKIAVGSGGVFGKGVGQSFQKFNYLPEASSDYIVAIYGEEFGFIGIMLLLVLYMFLVYIGYAIAMRSKTREGYYLAATFTFLLMIESFFNFGVVSGLLPSTGLVLPFFSQGGSSLIAHSIVIAILGSIATERTETGKEVVR